MTRTEELFAKAQSLVEALYPESEEPIGVVYFPVPHQPRWFVSHVPSSGSGMTLDNALEVFISEMRGTAEARSAAMLRAVEASR